MCFNNPNCPLRVNIQFIDTIKLKNKKKNKKNKIILLFLKNNFKFLLLILSIKYKAIIRKIFTLRIKLPKITEKGSKHNDKVVISKLKNFNLCINRNIFLKITHSFF